MRRHKKFSTTDVDKLVDKLVDKMLKTNCIAASVVQDIFLILETYPERACIEANH